MYHLMINYVILQLAPPATRLEDFEYHWKLILNFYQNYDQNCKERVEETRIPHHLNEMLQVSTPMNANNNNNHNVNFKCLNVLKKNS